ncbi:MULTISPECIES: aspartate 1-decarboxylase [Paenibacillus]|uniref:aspartate 1-decarboxylase n=1 Tax=Paenibacillus TaxID=44249 RepID=UPI001AE695AB|nr:aspartate 1-decarboxylase [Paenibacillus xylanexedens]MCF7753303.1 aspartate 1-decarboxylase [Paenibacillus xylanexedens]
MLLSLMKSKLHRATVTEANLNYVGSITIDQGLMEATNLLPNEKVQVVNINTGDRLETYVISGERGHGDICLNGAAARLVQPGDKVIIISYGLMTEVEAQNHYPVVAVLNDNNEIDQMILEKAHSTV